MARADDGERAAYIHARVQNAWLLQVWPAVDAHWQKHRSPEDPDHEALYLALGWTQATTTHQWPATDAWIARFEREPEHWSPRAQWHLCWLLADPDDAVHREGLAEALREGWDDAARPGMAREMWELFGLDEHS